MDDMNRDDIVGECREYTCEYHDGTQRKVFVTDHEVPYPDGRLIVSRTNPEGIITHVNQSFVEMSGYCEEELLGQPHHILRHPEMPTSAFADLWSTVKSGESWQGYVKNLRKDGAHYWVKATVIPNVRNGEVVGYTSVRRKPSRKKVQESEALYTTMS
ncbi:MAG: PAS domain-containing protein [Chromatiales bacterium]|nr:PAS domain-containing protein [Chromatiales bacterium]